jgi:hypothetical protein
MRRSRSLWWRRSLGGEGKVEVRVFMFCDFVVKVRTS